MIYSDSAFEKICFWGKPEYVKGVITFIDSQSIKQFGWLPASGVPAFMVELNNTDSLLTLYYPSVLFISGKYYEGRVYEMYQKI